MVNQRVHDLVKRYFSLGMNHTEILQSLVHLNNIVLSMRTLRRVLKSAALYRRKEYSDILDVGLSIYLMELLRNSNKSHGYKFVHLNCIQKGFVIRQETVRLLLQIADPAGAPFSHLFTELKISPIDVHISPIELEISPIQLKISAIELQISPNRPI